jgi:pimeloyl-ACP methyl ester carboxylesterase
MPQPLDYPLKIWGGQGAPTLLAVANGIPPEAYQPLLTSLGAGYRAMSLLPRALWENAPPPSSLRTWHDMAKDYHQGMAQHGLNHAIGIGHSMGGVALMLIALKEPARFRALILLDPTFLPVYACRIIRLMKYAGLSDRLPLVQKTLRRRRHFESQDQAVNAFRGRGVFSGWTEEALRAYVGGALRPNGTGQTLRWTPEWEARYFRQTFHTAWQEIPKMRHLTMPILILRAENSNLFFPNTVRLINQKVPNAELITLPAVGHMFPQQAPEESARHIQAFVAKHHLLP